MRSAPWSVSLAAHLAAGAALVVLPAFSPDDLPPVTRARPEGPLMLPRVLRVVPRPPAAAPRTVRAGAVAPGPAPAAPVAVRPAFVAAVAMPSAALVPEDALLGWGEPALAGEGGVPGLSDGMPGGLPGPAAASGSDAPVRVGGDIVAPQRIAGAAPRYPGLARGARIEGDVVVECTIDRDGSVRSVVALGGHPLLVPAALEAVRGWRYAPTLLNGTPVGVQMTITVRFRLSR